MWPSLFFFSIFFPLVVAILRSLGSAKWMRLTGVHTYTQKQRIRLSSSTVCSTFPSDILVSTSLQIKNKISFYFLFIQFELVRALLMPFTVIIGNMTASSLTFHWLASTTTASSGWCQIQPMRAPFRLGTSFL